MNAASAAIALVALLGLGGCATRVMAVPLVSMTRDTGASRAALAPAGRVNVEWCRGDPSLTGAGDPALMDEVILKAQRQRKADYVGDAVFWRKGNCMRVEGTALRARR